jgi:predicted nucleic acid-binding protein
VIAAVKVIVDTTVWSHAFRRRAGDTTLEVVELTRLIQKFRATLIGPIRQELLSGIAELPQFKKLRDLMGAFVNEPVLDEDYERAAEFLNICRKKGIQGSNTDFLICAVAARRQMPIFTLDQDFALFAKRLRVKLHTIAIRH